MKFDIAGLPRVRVVNGVNPNSIMRRMRSMERAEFVAVSRTVLQDRDLRTMHPDKPTVEVTPFWAKRSVTSTANHAAPDAQYWSKQMAAVSVHRDRASFMCIYDYFAPRLQRYLRNMNVPESVADELVQEALLTLWRKAAMFDPARASLATWLYRVARNLYIDQVRKEPHWLPVQEGLDRLDRAESDRRDSQPESFFDQDLLKQAIDRLSPVQAKLVRMCYLESKSHSEISRELAMPLGSVKSSLRRSFAKLQGSMRAPR
ncbi:MAG: sigma-70 family RNA polymerase sigma factor [Rhodanobacter sp.]